MLKTQLKLKLSLPQRFQGIQPSTLRFWFFSGSILFWLLASKPTVAEIIPDNTLPINSTVTPQGNIRVIEGGTRRGDNLFHSFKEFSFSVLTGNTTGDTAKFNNDSAVRNIITRVTGGSISKIDGILQANSTANLFFINPKGIIFGPNASLDIKGSFIASTASSLKFADGTEFSATTPQNSPLLTVSVPLGLQFGSNPGEIVNQSQASPNGTLNSVDSPVGLQVQGGRTLALIGGNVSLQGGNLTAAGGRIELGSVAEPSLVNLSEIETGYALRYAGVGKFQDIQLSQGAIVDASGSGGGAIQLQGRNITLTDNSQVISSTQGAGIGGNLIVNATASVKLSGGSNIATFAEGEGQAGDVLVRSPDSIEVVGTASDGSPSLLGSQVFKLATGNGGTLSVETRRLLVQDGAHVDASTFGAGRGGDVLVKADSIEVIGESQDGNNNSSISSQVAKGAIANAGDAGNLTIETRRLTALSGGQVSTATFAGGKAGTLTIHADSIQLSGASSEATRNQRRSGIFVTATREATADAGKLNIITRQLTVENAAEISANNFGPANGGTATLNVGQLIIRSGGEVRARSFGKGSGGNIIVNAIDSVKVDGSGAIGSETFPSALSTSAEASGNAGNLTIKTNSLNVLNGAEVSVSSAGTGQAGDLEVRSRSIKLDNQSKLIGESASTDGGNITLNLQDLLLLDRNSRISTSAGIAQKSGNGGNIGINTKNGFIIAVPNQNSDITANAFNGQGGKVTINATGIFGIAPLSREELERRIRKISPTLPLDPIYLPTNNITAISRTNPDLSGVVTINTPDVDPSRGLVNLPVTPVDTKVSQVCQPSVGKNQSSFIITGRGGLPPNPREPLSSDAVQVDWVTLNPKTENRSRPSVTKNPTPATPAQIVQATGWTRNAKGEVVLTADAPTATSHSSWQTPANCGTAESIK